MTTFSDKEIDALLLSVESALTKAESLAKSEALRKDFPPTDKKDNKDAPPAPPADDAAAPAPDAPPAPPMDAAPAPDAAPQAEPDGDEGAAPAPAEGEQGLEQEGADQPLSDEELDQIYGSMDPQELGRHAAAIQKYLQGGAPAAPGAPEAPPAPAPEAPAMKGEKGAQVKPGDSKSMGGMMKSEDIENLKKENEQLKQQFATLSKAVEILAQPKRKAVTMAQVIQKSEAEVVKKPVDKAEIKPRLTELTKTSNLTKSERDMINEYCLYGTGEDKMIKLIETKEGGK